VVERNDRQKISAKPIFVHQMRGNLIALLISVMTIGGVIYHFAEQSLLEYVKQSLQYHADFRQTRILALFEQQKRWMEESVEDTEFKQGVGGLMENYQRGDDSPSYQISSDHFRDEYALLLKAQGVDDLFLVDEEGALVFSLRPMDEELGVDLSEMGFYGETIFSSIIAQVLRERKLVISKYGKVEQVEESTVFMGIPMFSNFPGMEEELVAILIRPFSLRRLRALLESYSGLGESGEVIIAQWRGEGDGEGVNFINHFRHGAQRQPDQACQQLRREASHQFPVLHALKEESGAGWMLDNSCEKVFSVWSWLPELEWGMVVKQDRDEIMIPVAALQRNILIAALLVLLFLVWIGLRQARALVQPIVLLTQATERGEIEAHQPGEIEEVNHLAEVLQQSTAAIVKAKQETDLILESMDEGLLVVNAAGEILRVNPKLEQLMGRGSEQLRGESANSLFSAEQELITGDGSTIPVNLARSALDSMVGEQGREVWVIHDLRELLIAENAIRANKAKDQFFARMSHELRTPLAAIIGYSEMLGKRSWEHLQQKERNMLHSIEVAGRTQLALINDILDLSKVEAGKFEIDEADYALSSLLSEIDHIFSIRAQDAGLDFQVRQPEMLHHQLVGDPKRVGQILMNLLSNAIKFTQQGSVLLDVAVDQAEQKIHFRVEDDGVGMSAEVLERLFQSFEQADSSITRRFGGTGLGLHISKILAELMGGTLEVESEEGRGSRFQLNLPFKPSEKLVADTVGVEQRDGQPPTQNLQLKGKVLLVEDTVELQKLEQYVLESMGATVTLAQNGQEAVDTALKSPFDLILMDMRMPVMGGVEATRILRQRGYQGGVVALTANVMKQHREDFKAAGCDDFLTKPIDQDELRGVLQRYLSQISTPPVNTVSDASGAIDSKILEQLRPVFVERMSALRGELEQALSARDWERLHGAAHNIKGSAAPYGYPRLSELGSEICDEIVVKQIGLLPELVEQLIVEIDQALV